MGTFQVKTPRTPEGAERRADRIFEEAIELYVENMPLTKDGHMPGNTIEDKELGMKVSLVPCFVGSDEVEEDLAILDVEEYSSSSDQKKHIPTAKTTYLLDDKGNICEVCYSDSRKFIDDPFYAIYDDKHIDDDIVKKFEEANVQMNASFLDSLGLSLSLYDYSPDGILDATEKYAYPTLLKTYAHQRLDEYVDSEETSAGLENLDLEDLVEITNKILEMDDDEIQELAEEDELGE